MEGMRQETAVVSFKVLSLNLPGWAEENSEASQDYWNSGWIWKMSHRCYVRSVTVAAILFCVMLVVSALFLVAYSSRMCSVIQS